MRGPKWSICPMYPRHGATQNQVGRITRRPIVMVHPHWCRCRTYRGGGPTLGTRAWRIPEGLRRRREDEHGAEMVEFAVVVVLLIALLYGIITYGLILAAQATITQAAADATRAGIVSSTTADSHRRGPGGHRRGLDEQGNLRHLDGTTITCATPYQHAVPVERQQQCLKVTVTYNYSSCAALPRAPGPRHHHAVDDCRRPTSFRSPTPAPRCDSCSSRQESSLRRRARRRAGRDAHPHGGQHGRAPGRGRHGCRRRVHRRTAADRPRPWPTRPRSTWPATSTSPTRCRPTRRSRRTSTPSWPRWHTDNASNAGLTVTPGVWQNGALSATVRGLRRNRLHHGGPSMQRRPGHCEPDGAADLLGRLQHVERAQRLHEQHHRRRLDSRVRLLHRVVPGQHRHPAVGRAQRASSARSARRLNLTAVGYQGWPTPTSRSTS